MAASTHATADPFGDGSDLFGIGGGPSHTGFSMFLPDRVKNICFVRHAQGYHNLVGKEEIMDPSYYDARLTEAGISQCGILRQTFSETPFNGLKFSCFDLVVVSPLTRTLQTAQHVFGPPRKLGVPPFLSEYFENTDMPRPHFLVREECRERYGLYQCDGRRSISELITEFPDYDFSEIENDEDVYHTAARETSAHLAERSIQFLEWLNKRPEKSIAVVTHGSFLRHMFAQFGGNLSLDDRDRLQRVHDNCEFRFVVLCSHGIKDGRALSKMTQS